jgi:hypothetical protein
MMPLLFTATSNQLKDLSLLFPRCLRMTNKLTSHLQVSDIFPAILNLVYSSSHVEMQPLQETMNIVIAGRWTDKNAGGCHLYDKEFISNSEAQTWVNNPKYLLKFDSKDPVDVKITLSRPEGPWKKPVGKNLVGCMIGFYVHVNG